MRKNHVKTEKKVNENYKMNKKLPYLLNVAKWQQQLFYDINTT